MLELDEHGRVKNLVGLLATRGYELGSDVRRLADKTVGKIQEVKNDFVYILLNSGDIAGEPNDKILGNDWAVFKPKDDAQVLVDLSLYGPYIYIYIYIYICTYIYIHTYVYIYI